MYLLYALFKEVLQTVLTKTRKQDMWLPGHDRPTVRENHRELPGWWGAIAVSAQGPGTPTEMNSSDTFCVGTRREGSRKYPGHAVDGNTKPIRYTIRTPR